MCDTRHLSEHERRHEDGTAGRSNGRCDRVPTDVSELADQGVRDGDQQPEPKQRSPADSPDPLEVGDVDAGRGRRCIAKLVQGQPGVANGTPEPGIEGRWLEVGNE